MFRNVLRTVLNQTISVLLLGSEDGMCGPQDEGSENRCSALRICGAEVVM